MPSRGGWEAIGIMIKEFMKEYLENRQRLVYKYLRIDKAVEWLLFQPKGKIVFVEPSKWSDPTESVFYKAKLLISNQKECQKPIVFATCFTKNQASEASWVVYQHAKKDDDRPEGCIKLSIRFDEFLNQLRKWIKKEEGNGRKYSLFYGNVMYYEWSELKEIQKRGSKMQLRTFNACATIKENFLKTLLLKRKAYEYENELRVFLVLESGEYDMAGLEVKIDWNKCIRKIYYDESIDPKYLSKLQRSEFCKKVEKSTLMNYKNDFTIVLPNIKSDNITND